MLSTFVLLSADAPRGCVRAVRDSGSGSGADITFRGHYTLNEGTDADTADGAERDGNRPSAWLNFSGAAGGSGAGTVNTGFGGRSAAHSMLSAMSVFAVAVLAYFLRIWLSRGLPENLPIAITEGGFGTCWEPNGGYTRRGFTAGASPGGVPATVQRGYCGVIPLGAGSDRWRLGPSCASTAILAGITYPIFAHLGFGAAVGWHNWGGPQGGGNGALDAGAGQA